MDGRRSILSDDRQLPRCRPRAVRARSGDHAARRTDPETRERRTNILARIVTICRGSTGHGGAVQHAPVTRRHVVPGRPSARPGSPTSGCGLTVPLAFLPTTENLHRASARATRATIVARARFCGAARPGWSDPGLEDGERLDRRPLVAPLRAPSTKMACAANVSTNHRNAIGGRGLATGRTIFIRAKTGLPSWPRSLRKRARAAVTDGRVPPE